MYKYYAKYYDAGQMRFSVLMCSYIQELLQYHPIAALGGAGTGASASPRRIVDLACGTGTLALLMAEDGWDVLGLDRSAEMLQVAQRKTRQYRTAGHVRFRRADMRSFTVKEQAHLVTCLYDSLNYIEAEDELLAVFKNVWRALLPGGLWIFDMNTPYFLEHVWGAVEVEEREGYLHVMQSHFENERCTSTLVLTAFAREDDGRYRRFDETHVERGYSIEIVNSLLEQAGLQVEATYDCFTTNAPSAESHRLAWVARRPEGAQNEY